MSFIVAIDGPAGTGKGTVTESLTKKLGLVNVDTGATYRCVATAMLEENIKLEQLDKIKELLEKIDIEFKNENGQQLVFLNGKNVTEKIRSKEVSSFVSPVSSIKEVRFKMVDLQRKLAEGKNVIMEGRDIGTYVFPNADVKIYMDADLEVRAKRRFEQNKEKGIEMSYEEVLKNIISRDENDKAKEIGALKQADDAVFLDTTNLSIEANVKAVEDIILEKMPEDVKMQLGIEEKKNKELETCIKKERLKRKNRKKDIYALRPDTKWKLFERKIVKAILHGLYKIVYRIEIIGAQNIPQEGACIICPNHVNYLDAVGLVTACKRKVNFVGKDDLFDNPILCWLGRLFDVIPVKRGQQDMEFMKRTLKLLKNGEVLGLFPEGTRKGIVKTGKLKNGAAFLSLRTGSPVIPCGIQGNFKPFTKVTIIYGKPLVFEKTKEKAPDKEELDKVSRIIMDNIIMLTNKKN